MENPNNNAVLRGAVDLSALRNRVDPATAAASGSEIPAIFAANEQNFGQIMEWSRVVPVVLLFTTANTEEISPSLATLQQAVAAHGGKIAFGTVDADAETQIVAAFGIQTLPMAVALVAAQPVPLFQGSVSPEQASAVLQQLLQLAAQQGVVGQAKLPDAASEADSEQSQLSPLQAEAYAAIEAGDYAKAIAAYEKAITENPKDDQAKAGLAQVKLLDRLNGKNLQQARDAAAANAEDLQAALLVADFDLSGGHVEDAFDRLLLLFADADPEQKSVIRERLLELFEVVGSEDPRVNRARTRLTSLLF